MRSSAPTDTTARPQPEVRHQDYCFARRHMKPAIFGFYTYVLQLTSKTGVFYTDTRRDAWEFSVDRGTIATWTKFLARRGWLRLTSKSTRHPVTGMWSQQTYGVLTHKQWVEAMGTDQCRYLEDYKLERHRAGKPSTVQVEHPQQNPQQRPGLQQISSGYPPDRAGNPSFTVPDFPVSPCGEIQPKKRSEPERCAEERKEKGNNSNSETVESFGKTKPPERPRPAPRPRRKAAAA